MKEPDEKHHVGRITDADISNGLKLVNRSLDKLEEKGNLNIKLIFLVICHTCSNNKRAIGELRNYQDNVLKGYDFSDTISSENYKASRQFHRKNIKGFLRPPHSKEKTWQSLMQRAGLPENYKGFEQLGGQESKQAGIGFKPIQILFYISAEVNERTLEEHIVCFIKEYLDRTSWVKKHQYLQTQIEEILVENSTKSTEPEKLIAYDKSYLEDTPASNLKVESEIATLALKIRWVEGNNESEPKVCEIEESSDGKSLFIPNTYENRCFDQPSSIISWSSNHTEIVGRGEEMRELNDWLNLEAACSVKFIFGLSGVGKSKLAFSFAKKSILNGWRSGKPDWYISGNWCIGEKKKILFILDDVDFRKKSVGQFLNALACYDNKIKAIIRVLLVSRYQEVVGEMPPESSGLFHKHLSLKPMLNQQNLLLYENINSSFEHINPSFQSRKISDAQFHEWLNLQPSPVTPLNVLLLTYAILLSDGKDFEPSLQMNSITLIELIVKAEESFILRQVESEVSIDNKAIPEAKKSACLIIAIAVMFEGITLTQLQFINERLKHRRQPEIYIKALQSTRYWFDQRVNGISDRTISAYFLGYCLRKYTGSGEHEWITSCLVGYVLDPISSGKISSHRNLDKFSSVLSSIVIDFGYSDVLEKMCSSMYLSSNEALSILACSFDSERNEIAFPTKQYFLKVTSFFQKDLSKLALIEKYYYAISIIHYGTSNSVSLDKMTKSFNICLEFFSIKGLANKSDFTFLMIIYRKYSKYFYDSLNYSLAIEYLLKSLYLAENSKNRAFIQEAEIAKSLVNLGLAYISNNQGRKGRIAYSKAHDIWSRIGWNNVEYRNDICIHLINYANFNAIQLVFQPHIVERYQQLCLNLSDELITVDPTSAYGIRASSLHNLAISKIFQKKVHESIEALNKAKIIKWKLYENNKDDRGISYANTCNLLGCCELVHANNLGNAVIAYLETFVVLSSNKENQTKESERLYIRSAFWVGQIFSTSSEKSPRLWGRRLFIEVIKHILKRLFMFFKKHDSIYLTLERKDLLDWEKHLDIND